MFLQRTPREKWILTWRHMSTPTCSGEMRTMYGMRLVNCASDEQQKKKKKCADLSAIQKINQALWPNADLASKPCVLQHFGFPPFSSITSKYCKGCKFHKKGGFKMLENCGVVPGPLTSFIPQGSTQSLLVYQSRRTSTRELKCFS